jgi:hypothetical protein
MIDPLDEDILCTDCGYPDWWVDNSCPTCSLPWEEAVMYLTVAEAAQLDSMLDT